MIRSVASFGDVLGVWAHPDDEAYLMGGLMALAIDAGQHVSCLTATLGDAGETADPDRWPIAELPRIRRDELARSLGVLGVEDHECLHLPDGRLDELDAEAPVSRIAAAIDRRRPDTVITFGPDGMTGHPDHRTIGAWTRLALHRYPARPRLLLATKTEAWAAEFTDVNAEVFPPGLPPRLPDDGAWVLHLDDEVLARKVQALEAHASQTAGLIAAVGRDRYAAWVRQEAFEPA
jgi:LmbE family N-acetylglucosaminyl deacetylase